MTYFLNDGVVNSCTGQEVVAPSKRTLVSFYSNMFYVAGLMGFSGLAYAVPQWQWMALVTSLPFVSYYVYVLYELSPNIYMSTKIIF